MRVKSLFIIAGFLCFTLLFIPIRGASAAGDVITLKFANFFPPPSAQSKLCEDFSAELEKRTDGKVKIRYLGYPLEWRNHYILRFPGLAAQTPWTSPSYVLGSVAAACWRSR